MTATDTRTEQVTADLERTVRALLELVPDLIDDVNSEAEIDQRRGLMCWHIIQHVRSKLGEIDDDLGERLAQGMRYGVPVNLPGVATFHRHQRKDRTDWDTDDLLRYVLDSRIVDPLTGEVRDETPVDKLLHVWNLGKPRTTALKARGLAPYKDEDGNWNDPLDDYCHTERGRLGLRVTP